jgi:hypothetical protein
MSDADDRFAIIATLDAYSECLDTRDWDRLSEVFTDDVDMDFGAWRQQGRAKVTKLIRSYLDGCGPSQHLLGNYRIELDGDRASSRCYCRVMHQGKGEHAGKKYETWIEYSDELIRTEAGWRSQKRVGHAQMHEGDPSLLGPG